MSCWRGQHRNLDTYHTIFFVQLHLLMLPFTVTVLFAALQKGHLALKKPCQQMSTVHLWGCSQNCLSEQLQKNWPVKQRPTAVVKAELVEAATSVVVILLVKLC